MRSTRSLLVAILSIFGLAVVSIAGPASADLDHTTWANAGNNAVVARDCDGQPGVQCRAYFPDLVVAGSGELLLVYRWASSHVGTRGDIRMKRSADGGQTWSGEQVIATNASWDLRDPSIVKLSTGRLVLSYFTYDGAGSLVVGTETRTSDTDGAAWAAPVSVPWKSVV